MNNIEHLLKLDFEKSEELKRYYIEHVQDSFYSKGYFLRWSSASSFWSAAKAFSDLIQMWEKNLERNDADEAEIATLLSFHYNLRVSGPITSAVLMPTFAMESFLRLFAEVVLAEQTTTAKSWRLALSGFDKQNFLERLKSVLVIVDAKRIPRQLEASVENLIYYRNDFVHDIPLWNIEGGHQIHLRRGKARLVKNDKAFGGQYPVLHNHVMPLRLSHATQAVATHDDLVTHIMDHSEKEFKELLKKRGGRWSSEGIHIKPLLGTLWDQASLIDEFWVDRVLSWFDAIPMKEQKNFIRKLVRKSQIKPVK